MTSIVQALDGFPSLTLGDLYRRNVQHSWDNFIVCVNYLISEGYMEGKGDGFAVYYTMTSKARNGLDLNR